MIAIYYSSCCPYSNRTIHSSCHREHPGSTLLPRFAAMAAVLLMTHNAHSDNVLQVYSSIRQYMLFAVTSDIPRRLWIFVCSLSQRFNHRPSSLSTPSLSLFSIVWYFDTSCDFIVVYKRTSVPQRSRLFPVQRDGEWSDGATLVAMNRLCRWQTRVRDRSGQQLARLQQKKKKRIVRSLTVIPPLLYYFTCLSTGLLHFYSAFVFRASDPELFVASYDIASGPSINCSNSLLFSEQLRGHNVTYHKHV